MLQCTKALSRLVGVKLRCCGLLLAGHDAKSVARDLGLSVHTVNDRLRDARRKLGVSSSREAARILADAEHKNPEFYADKKNWGYRAACRGRGRPEPGDTATIFLRARKWGSPDLPCCQTVSRQADARQ